jgi:restriction system protein
MGALWFEAEVLADSLSETVGYKAGLAMSIEQMCDHLSGTRYPDVILQSELAVVRLRSEDYEDLYYKLLHRVGYTAEEYNGDVTGVRLFHKYKNTADFDSYMGVTRLYVTMWPTFMEAANARGTKKIDPTPFLLAAKQKYGRRGLEMAFERLEVISKALDLSPHSTFRYTDWKDILQLKSLFDGSNYAPAYGEFLDQRFIDYLSNNPDAIGKMHWRKFEELTAEYFAREGFRVELGPGGNDDGVDVRIWKPNTEGASPHGIIQCKRQKDKIERVVVKGLMTDVMFEKADIGLIVTSSELSPGARKTITARGYPIKEVNKEGVFAWLAHLRTPGTGIVRR